MMLGPRPPRQLRPMPDEAFPDDVILRPSLYPLTTQGGANPVPGTDYPYRASVQPISQRAADTSLGSVQSRMPQSFTRYDVLIKWADDPVIRALRIGDKIVFGSLRLVVQSPADDFGLKKVFHIKCEHVQS